MRSWSTEHHADVGREATAEVEKGQIRRMPPVTKWNLGLVLWAVGSLRLGEIKRGFLRDRRDKDIVQKERVGRPRRAGALMSLGSRERLRSGLELA